jgi:hypothetical protein
LIVLKWISQYEQRKSSALKVIRNYRVFNPVPMLC